MSTPKETALSACRQLMAPIIGILLRNGVTYKDLTHLCKQIYVEVASKEFGIRGRDTNLSRVAMLTGIDRKEVARVKEAWKHNDESERSQHGQDRMTRVLTGWHQDQDFIDASGKPLIIPVDGDVPSFAQLVKRYGGDMPASALLKELKRGGVITTDEQANLHVLKRHYVPSQSDPGALLRAGSVINDLGNTLYHNLYKADPEKNKPLHFERRASNIQMSAESADAFRAFVEQEGQAFLEKIDAWLSAHEQVDSHEQVSSHKQASTHAQTDATSSAAQVKQQTIRLGVGTYLIEDIPPVEQKSLEKK